VSLVITGTTVDANGRPAGRKVLQGLPQRFFRINQQDNVIFAMLFQRQTEILESRATISEAMT